MTTSSLQSLSMVRHRRAAWLLMALCLGMFLLLASLPASAQTYLGSPTNLASNDELMVSYRHQERMWQTPDGMLNLITNGGTLQPNPGLVLYRSIDGGSTWLPAYALSGSDKNSTVDGVFHNGVLTVVYSDANSYAQFLQLSYDVATGAWTPIIAETLYASQQYKAVNPTVALDDLGGIWCGFAKLDRNTSDISIGVVARSSDTGVWADTGLTYGPTDNISKERSARMVRLSGGIGMIYRVRQSTYWTFRSNGTAITSDWSPATSISEGMPQKKLSDPYASHFSVIADANADLHLAIADDGNAMYLKYSLSTSSWTTPRKLNGKRKISYLQIGLWNGNVALSFSASRGAGAVVLSTDFGETFNTDISLVLPTAATGVSYKTGRLEGPGIVYGALPLLQQFEDNKTQRIMLFNVAASSPP